MTKKMRLVFWIDGQRWSANINFEKDDPADFYELTFFSDFEKKYDFKKATKKDISLYSDVFQNVFSLINEEMKNKAKKAYIRKTVRFLKSEKYKNI